MNWAQHYNKWILCTRCPLHENRHKVVLGMGKIAQPPHPGATFMVMGKHPGKDEDRIGLPMQGKAGHWVSWAITQLAGISYDECFFGNVLGCTPKGTPKAEFLKACAPRVDELVQMVQPKLIISMGLETTKFFSGDRNAKMTHLAGTTGKFAGFPVVYTTHPFEPGRQNSITAKEASEARVQSDFRTVRKIAIEMGLVERTIE